MERHLIVISVDAMVTDDLPFLKNQPNMGQLMREGSVVWNVETISPARRIPSTPRL